MVPLSIQGIGGADVFCGAVGSWLQARTFGKEDPYRTMSGVFAHRYHRKQLEPPCYAITAPVHGLSTLLNEKKSILRRCPFYTQIGKPFLLLPIYCNKYGMRIMRYIRKATQFETLSHRNIFYNARRLETEQLSPFVMSQPDLQTAQTGRLTPTGHCSTFPNLHKKKKRGIFSQPKKTPKNLRSKNQIKE